MPANFLASNDSQRVKYLHPVSILIKIGVLVRKPFGKKCPPLVNDEDQAPSEGVLGKTNSILIESKDGILL